MLSDNIRRYRKESNMSQDELAEKLGVSRQSISLWETGQSQPTIDNIIALTKIFKVPSDAILGNADPASGMMNESQENSLPEDSCGGSESTDDPREKAPEEKKKSKKAKAKKSTLWITLVSVIVAAAIVGGVIWLAFSGGKGSDDAGSAAASTIGSSSEQQTPGSNTTDTNSKTAAPATSKAPQGTNVTGTQSTASKAPQTTQSSQAGKNFDIFTYCKEYAIKKGTLNGDYCMYQQPATRYGGYEDEYFSISYWGDSNMVEFCLHCPLDDTYSVNFYLRMRGGYHKKYEYLSSRYYRSNGESLRSATGYIDPAVFSDKYPLSCDKYTGSADGQNSFMEESRVGICDLIHCLKNFVEVEKLECRFSDFGFVNY